MLSKCTKMNLQEYPYLGCNVLEFFCAPLYTDFPSDHSKKFQVACTYDISAKCQIIRFCYNLFLTYAVNRHTDTHIHTHKSTVITDYADNRHTDMHT